MNLEFHPLFCKWTQVFSDSYYKKYLFITFDSFFFFLVIVHINTKDKPFVDRNTLEILKMLTQLVMATGATPNQIGEVVMEDKDLRDVVKAT